jgi:hypothetical protein
MQPGGVGAPLRLSAIGYRLSAIGPAPHLSDGVSFCQVALEAHSRWGLAGSVREYPEGPEACRIGVQVLRLSRSEIVIVRLLCACLSFVEMVGIGGPSPEVEDRSTPREAHPLSLGVGHQMNTDEGSSESRESRDSPSSLEEDFGTMLPMPSRRKMAGLERAFSSQTRIAVSPNMIRELRVCNVIALGKR